MSKWETIWEFRTKRFRVSFDVAPDNDLDLSWDDSGEVLRGLQSGKYIAFLARVAVHYHGDIVGEDILGGCIYETAQEFRDHIGLASKAKKDGCNYGSYFVDMIHTAIKEARKNLTSQRPYIRSV